MHCALSGLYPVLWANLESRLARAQLNSLGVAAQVCNNMALAVQMASIAEASAMGRRLGLDPKVLAEVFNSSSARCWSSEAYNPVPVWLFMHLSLWMCGGPCI